MTAARPSRRRSRRAGLRRSLPYAYLGVAMLAAVVVLPTALRPPPDPAQQSGAISPDAPPDQNNPEQLLQSIQQASGGGAGAAAGAVTTTTALGAPPPPIVTSTTAARKAGSGYCFGKPPRQIESVYSGPCVPAYSGPNGGATSKNVLPNEVRLGFTNLGAPAKGRVPDGPTPNESSGTRTFRVFQQYFNSRFETYGRKVVFYGDGDPASAADTDQQSYATMLADDPSYQLFGIYSTSMDACEHFVDKGLVAMCDPLAHHEYTAHRPGLFSRPMDLDEMFGFGAEYTCKTLVGKPAKFGGVAVQTQTRKISYDGFSGTQGGAPSSHFAAALSKECGATVVDPVDMAGETDSSSAAAAVARWQTDKVTTVVLSNVVSNVLLLMQAASSAGYQPEWVLLGNYSIDNNTIGSALPKDQTAHLFGLTWQEWPQPGPATECFRAYHSIDPDNDPDTSACSVDWQTLVLLFDAIQGAGPNLTPATFQKALFDLGHRYDQTVWNVGGGYGPDDYSYPDAVAEIWYDPSAVDPSLGAPGAYRYTHDGHRYQRGQLAGDDSQIQRSGSTAAPAG